MLDSLGCGSGAAAQLAWNASHCILAEYSYTATKRLRIIDDVKSDIVDEGGDKKIERKKNELSRREFVFKTLITHSLANNVFSV